MKKEKLHIIAPVLSEISPKKNVFKVPEAYFDSIEDAVISTLDLQKRNAQSNSSTFKTPKNYFDTVEDIVLAKLKAETIYDENEVLVPADYFSTIEDRVLSKLKPQQKIISIKRVTKYVAPLAIAASLLLIFVLNTKQKSVTFDSLATVEIEEFIESGLVDLNSENLAIAFSDIELPTSDLATSISDTEVLEYLTIENLETIIYED